MKTKKADWAIVRDHEKEGLVVAMTSLVERIRTDLNKELSDYFRNKMPKYKSCFDEDESEDVLYGINSYLEEKKIDKRPMDFPVSEGSDIHLIPIGDNINLKVLVCDEYYGSGDYSKYVDISYFLINDKTTKSDVDELISFIKEYLKVQI